MIEYIPTELGKLHRGRSHWDYIPSGESKRFEDLYWFAVLVGNKKKFWALWKYYKRTLIKDDCYAFYFDPFYFNTVSVGEGTNYTRTPGIRYHLFYYALLGISELHLTDRIKHWFLSRDILLAVLKQRCVPYVSEVRPLFNLGLLEDNIPLDIGAPVILNKGVFSNMEGIISAVNSEFEVEVDVILMGQVVKVTCNTFDLTYI